MGAHPFLLGSQGKRGRLVKGNPNPCAIPDQDFEGRGIKVPSEGNGRGP